MLDPLTALARAWYVTMFVTMGLLTGLTIYPYWTTEMYWRNFADLWTSDF